MLFLQFLACGQEVICAEGFEERDGVCYEQGEAPVLTVSDPLTVQSILNDLPACTSAESGDGTLDLFERCAGGICAGTSLEDALAALGQPDSVNASAQTFVDPDRFIVYLHWGDLMADFPDDDIDEQPDPGSVADGVSVYGTFAGSTEDGLGLGDELSCFVGLSQVNFISLSSLSDGTESILVSFEAFTLSSEDGIVVDAIYL